MSKNKQPATSSDAATIQAGDVDEKAKQETAAEDTSTKLPDVDPQVRDAFIKELSAAVEQTKQSEQLTDVFEERMKFLEEHGSANEQHVVTVLRNYVEVCTTSIELDKIGMEQQRLWRLFMYIHHQPQEFKKLFAILIDFAKKYKEECFSIDKFFRAQQTLNLSKDDLRAFDNLRTLVINTAESVDKRKIKAIVDIRKIVEHNSIPEHIRSSYISFYS